MRILQLPIALIALLTLPACEVIGTIFQAGMWAGVIAVVVVIGLVVFVLSIFRR